MCFTPTISISTAIIEFILAAILLIKFKKGYLRNLLVILLILLGMYQFSEFMLCTSNNSTFWALIGFSSYLFLPAIGLHIALKRLKSELPIWTAYVIPLLFLIYAVFSNNFIISATCETHFVNVQTTLDLWNFWSINGISGIFLLYYFGFIVVGGVIAYISSRKSKSRYQKISDLALVIGIFGMLIPPFIIITLLPSFGILYPSIFCQFAILIAIAAFISVIYSQKKK